MVSPMFEHLHEGDSHDALKNSQLNVSVEDESRQGTRDVLPEFRYIMRASLEEVVAYIVSKKKRWVRSVDAARTLGRKKRVIHHR